ncbi:hypothetical protein [Haloarchaeobius sp. DYHT-AS-18]|uniref:hypothetical protein n=1 Tax=Haloarchaeobius sp. DYHT-AS-18 TaxID=3446117 RepID=UPI003EBE2413
MNRRDVLGVLGAMGLSGCLRLEAGGGGGTDTGSPGAAPTSSGTRSENTATTTDAETTPEPTDEPADLPVGMAADGVTPLLADAHRSSLARTSYHLETALEKVGKETAHSMTVDNDGDRALLTRDGRVEKLWNEGRATWRGDTGGGWTYGVVQPSWGSNWSSGMPLDWLVQHWNLRTLIAGGDFDAPERTVRGDTTVFETSADSLADESAVMDLYGWAGPNRIADFSAELVADSDGIVRDFTADTRLVTDDELLDLHHTVTVSAVGTTSVADPPWLGQARENAPAISQRVEGDYLVLEHTGGNPVVSGSQFSMSGPDYDAYVDVPGELTAGESLWVWREGSDVLLSVGQPADAAPDALLDETTFHLMFHSADYAASTVEAIRSTQ